MNIVCWWKKGPSCKIVVIINVWRQITLSMTVSWTFSGIWCNYFSFLPFPAYKAQKDPKWQKSPKFYCFDKKNWNWKFFKKFKQFAFKVDRMVGNHFYRFLKGSVKKCPGWWYLFKRKISSKKGVKFLQKEKFLQNFDRR